MSKFFSDIAWKLRWFHFLFVTKLTISITKPKNLSKIEYGPLEIKCHCHGEHAWMDTTSKEVPISYRDAESCSLSQKPYLVHYVKALWWLVWVAVLCFLSIFKNQINKCTVYCSLLPVPVAEGILQAASRGKVRAKKSTEKKHGDVNTWKRFPHYWPFVNGRNSNAKQWSFICC